MNFKTTLALAALTVAGMTNASAASLVWTDASTGLYIDSSLGAGSFTEQVTFTLGASYDAVAIGANLISPLTNTALTSGTVTLFDATTNSQIGTTFDFTSGVNSESYTDLAAGDYYLYVTGSVAKGTDGAYALKLSLSPPTGGGAAVPEPATTALLLAGVGVMAFMSRRRLQK